MWGPKKCQDNEEEEGNWRECSRYSKPTVIHKTNAGGT